jgi:2-polyprenyl-3-methyl-5-hydroxy-6-metoxy-1,4-benzoquinol methylase
VRPLLANIRPRMSQEPLPQPHARACWCGDSRQFAWSPDYNVCLVCGTLVSRAVHAPDALEVKADAGELYSKDYWLKRQAERYGLPPIQQRARLDLPERCVHWLNLLLKRRLPPARVLELGCAHGAYVALLRWAGYDATGTEMSPAIVDLAKATFGVPVLAGRVEELPFAPASFDVVVLNDVIEHLPDPVATLRHCTALLKPDGFFIIQTPEYREHFNYEEIVRTGDLFEAHMKGKSEEHLFLFSRRSVQRLFAQLGFSSMAFENPIFSYDMFFTASRAPLPENSADAIAANLMQRPEGRLVLALLDKAYESSDRWWAIQRLEARLRERS